MKFFCWFFVWGEILLTHMIFSAVFSGGAGGARAPPEFGGSQKGRSLISAYQSLAITTRGISILGEVRNVEI